ncbi:putative secreted protein (Por secretion system target) [Ancylomarina subtilis]|uniref:Putative secreted protein (Por secretion system target) n=1 Tax=Ancylomarina subtilis TaxID=1639035 RepID=A0A4Q7VC37_9BACT|nr:Calx-beta domain-containing protein [Ancylomarina subtilis]RZT93407.1 putative secreted protein (Por secretion system target) [Ancylomarina subtilis]
MKKVYIFTFHKQLRNFSEFTKGLSKLIMMSFLLASMLFVSGNDASAQCTESFVSSNDSANSIETNVGQSFTACQDGVLTKVRVLSTAAYSNKTLTIYEGAGLISPLGSVSGVSLIIAPDGDFTSFSEIDVSSLNISVTNGSQYTFYFGSSTVSLKYANSDFYAGGTAYYEGSVIGVADFLFEVDIAAGSSNAAPTATAPSAPIVSEDDTNVALADDIQVADTDGDDQTVTFTITGGTLTTGTTGIIFGGSGNGSASFTAAGTLAAINTALDAATFTPTPNLNGTNAGVISFYANDGTENSNTASVTFNITAVNDDPTISGLPTDITVSEDIASNVDLSAATLSDVDAGLNSIVLTISASAGTLTAGSGGSVTIGGSGTGTLSLTGSVANIDTYLNTSSNIKYTSASNVNGNDAATLTLTANDGGYTGTGGGTDVSLGTVNVDITAVNDAPIISIEGSVLSYTENNTAIQIDASATVSDPDGDAEWNGGQLAIEIDLYNEAADEISISDTDEDGIAITISGANIFANGTDVGDLVPSGGVATGGTQLAIGFDSDATNAIVQEVFQSIRYRNTSDNPGTSNRVITIAALDAVLASKTVQRTIGVTAVNDDPTISGLPTDITVSEDIASNVDLSAATFNDVDAGANSIVLTIYASAGTLTASSGGSVTIGGSGTGTLSLTGSVANIDTYLNTSSNIKYTSASNVNGNNAATLTLTANDGGYTGSGGGTDVSLGTVNIDITAVNDTPTASSFTASLIYQNTAYEFSTANFSYSDIDSDPIDHLRITAVPSNGTLWIDSDASETVNGAEIALSNNSTVSKADLDAGYLKYLNTTGTSSSFTFDVNDGTDFSASTYTATLSVIPEPTVTLSLEPLSTMVEDGGTTNVKATLSHSFNKNVTVNLFVSGVATGSGTDYTLAASSIVISAGNTYNSVQLTSVSDVLDEDDETVIIDISTVINGVELGTQQVTATILDDDAKPAITFTYEEQNSIGESGIVNMTIQVFPASGRDISIPFSVNGSSTATIGADYSITASPVVIPAGDDEINIVVTINSDAIDENNETVIVDIGLVANAIPQMYTSQTINIIDDDALPTIAFNSTGSNGLESISSANLQVDLSSVSGRDVFVDYVVTGTATGADYTLANGTLTISAGAASDNITISSIVDDLLDEDNETVIVTLSNPVNSTLGTNTVHTYTINDNDALPTIAFNSTGSNGLESISSANLQVDLSCISGRDVLVDYAVTGTATGGGTDYTLANGTLTISAGAASDNITIASIINDLLDENNETVIVTLSNPVNATLGTNTVHTYTILNDDVAPTIEFIATSSSGAESVSSKDLQVDLSAASGLNVSVDYAVTGTATGDGTDYTLANGILTISAGSASDNITIASIINDLLDENNETVIVTLSNPVNATLATNNVHTYTINDDDAAPTIEFSSTSSNGLESVSSANLQIDLSAASGLTVTVDYAVTGTATGADYTLADGTLTIAAGDASDNITIGSIVDDLLDENNETVIVTLSNPTNATLGSNTVHTYTITDNDATPTIEFSSISSNGLESVSSANLQVGLSAASSFDVTVDYTVTGTATSADYTLADGMLTFAAGDLNKNITIASIVDDLLDENNETVIVTLSNQTNAILGSNTVHTYTITDNDATPTIEFSSISSNGLESVSSANLQVDISTASGLVVTVDYTVTGTATSADYTLADGTLTFAAGDLNKNITIASIVDDLLDENNEMVILTLSNPTNATLGSNTVHTYMITDNDATPTIEFSSTSSNGLESVSSANLQVDISTVSGLVVTVDYTVTGTATSADYTLADGTLTFAAGDLNKNITIASIVDDLLDENNETVIVTLSNPTNATLGSNTVHTYTINDNDGIRVVDFNSTSSNGLESVSSADLQVDLSAASGLTVTVDYTVTGTATSADYTLADGTLTLAAGDLNKNITIASIVDDLLDENNETVIVTLSNPTNATLGSNTVHTYTITDNDSRPVITSSQSFAIDEDISNDESVGIILATDADTGTILSSWSIVDGNVEAIFAISSTTGELRVVDNTKIDFEKVESYTLGIMVSDGINTSTVENVNVNVVDVNDNKPLVIENQSFSVNEMEANNTSLGMVLASDNDSGTALSKWKIMSGNSVGIFGINSSTGELRIFDNTNLDFERTNHYTLGICVSDGKNISAIEDVFVTIIDVNERPIANAGENQFVPNNSRVELNAWHSYDPDGDYLDFVWSAPEGIELSDVHDPKPTFMSPNVLVLTDFVFKLIVNDGELDSEESSVVVTVDNVTGIEEIDSDPVNVSLYPNPSKGAFYIELNKRPTDGAALELINLSGKLIYSQKLYEKKTYLNLSLKSGMYFLKVELDNRTVMKKIIIE